MSVAAHYLCLPVGYRETFEVRSLVMEDPLYLDMWMCLLDLAFRARDRGVIRDPRGRRIGPKRFAQIYLHRADEDSIKRCVGLFRACVDLELLSVDSGGVYRVCNWGEFQRKREILTSDEIEERRENARERKRKQREREALPKPTKSAVARAVSRQEATQQEMPSSQSVTACHGESQPVTDCPPLSRDKKKKKKKKKKIDLRSSSSSSQLLDLTARGEAGDEEDEDVDLVRDIKARYPLPRGQPLARRSRETQSFADVMRRPDG